ncbi:hypothetical protein EDE15_4421 [Edaphobacter aggregans]|uniref:DUF2381 family protein n=1 Tax=Edaphobacter aggregans TaxID=570835 RepID=A0A3R9P1B0_9BACT|nr:hypothetical protein [Edaphobacter aggregans]RSL18818.1 hypothetical protein EDE15_4421 [Edaphobacter aggregans]
MYSIRMIGFISVLTGAVLSQAQQITSVTTTQAEVKPLVTDLPVSTSSVTDLHLRPLFTTTIRLPEAVTSVAVGAPTLFEVEHSDQEPRLVFVKPSTKESATSNLVIALQSGQEISMRLLSDGNGGDAPVDFVVNYRPPQSFLIGSSDAAAHSVETARDERPKIVPAIDQALKIQAEIATPSWIGGLAKDERNPDGKAAEKPLAAALGAVREKGEEMLVAYSVMNTTNHWIEVLPPQVELNSPNLGGDKKKDKKHEILAEQIPITDYRLNARRLAPGERADGAVQFARPGFKQSKDRLLLQLATASAVDTPLLMPVPFVAPER